MQGSTFRALLKSATEAHHRRVDDAFSRFDLAQEAGIEAFLTAQAAALLPIEAAIEAWRNGSGEDPIPDWADRRRAPLLNALGLDPPRLAFACPTSKGESLGVLYVIEGSKLGARVLLRRVARSPGPFAAAAMRFLGHDAGPDQWPSFLQHLDRHADVQYHGAALQGAVAAFCLFESAADRVAERRERRQESDGSVARGGAEVQPPEPRRHASSREHAGT